MQVNKVMERIRWETRGMPTDGTERRNENEIMTNDGVRTGWLLHRDFFSKDDDDDDPRTKSDAVCVIGLSACLSSHRACSICPLAFSGCWTRRPGGRDDLEDVPLARADAIRYTCLCALLSVDRPLFVLSLLALPGRFGLEWGGSGPAADRGEDGRRVGRSLVAVMPRGTYAVEILNQDIDEPCYYEENSIRKNTTLCTSLPANDIGLEAIVCNHRL
jgi:hypothetical protein